LLRSGNSFGDFYGITAAILVGAAAFTPTVTKEGREAEYDDYDNCEEGDRSPDDQRGWVALGSAAENSLERAFGAGYVSPGPPFVRRLAGRVSTHALGV
jgi:hypothetical protein